MTTDLVRQVLALEGIYCSKLWFGVDGRLQEVIVGPSLLGAFSGAVGESVPPEWDSESCLI